MKKIVIIHPYLNCHGGAERKVIHLRNYLKKEGNIVDIFTFDFSKESTFYEYLNDTSNIYELKGNYIYKLIKIIKVCRREKYDICICSNYPAHFYGYVIKKLSTIKSILWICNEIHSKLNPPKTLVKKIFTIIEKKIIKNFDNIITNSKNTHNQVLKYFHKKSTIIYPGVNMNTIGRVKDEQKKYFFCLSRATYDKNIIFLEKIIKNSSHNIIFVGSGPMSSYLEDLERSYNNFEYYKNVGDNEKNRLFSNADLFLFLPLNEPFGVTIIESLNLGTPVISFNSGGPKEIIINKKNGILCDNEAEYIKYISDYNHKSFAYEPEYFKSYVTRNFSLNQMLKNFGDLIQLS